MLAYDKVMGILRSQQAQNDLPNFKVVELNGMRLVDPHQVNASSQHARRHFTERTYLAQCWISYEKFR